MAYSKAKLQNSGVEASPKHVRQMLAYPDIAIDFSETQFHDDTELLENNIQDLPPN